MKLAMMTMTQAMANRSSGTHRPAGPLSAVTVALVVAPSAQIKLAQQSCTACLIELLAVNTTVWEQEATSHMS